MSNEPENENRRWMESEFRHLREMISGQHAALRERMDETKDAAERGVKSLNDHVEALYKRANAGELKAVELEHQIKNVKDKQNLGHMITVAFGSAFSAVSVWLWKKG